MATNPQVKNEFVVSLHSMVLLIISRLQAIVIPALHMVVIADTENYVPLSEDVYYRRLSRR